MAILPVILLANIFSGMTLNLNFWYKQTGDTRYALWITGTGLIVTVGLNVLMVPSMGYVGAAWARLGCETVMLLLSYASIAAIILRLIRCVASGSISCWGHFSME